MAAFKVIEESLVEASSNSPAVPAAVAVCTDSPISSVPVEVTVATEQPTLDVEEALVAEVTKVADEVANSVCVPEPEATATVEEELVTESTEAVANNWDASVVTAPPVTPVIVEVAAVAPVIEEAVVVVESTVAAVELEAPKPIERPAAQDWFSPSRAFPSGTTRASLWGELGGSHDTLAAPATLPEPASITPPPVPQAEAVIAPTSADSWDDSWNSAPSEPTAPLATNTELEPVPQPRTVVAEPAPLSDWNSTNESVAAPVSTITAPAIETSFAVEDRSTTEPTSPTPKAPEPQPTVWRAAKNDWFGVEAEPRTPDVPVATPSSRLADSIFDATPTHSGHDEASIAEMHDESASSSHHEAVEQVATAETHADSTGHGDYFEEQLAEGIFESENVVESSATVVEAAATAPVNPTSDAKRPAAPAEVKAKRTVLVVDDSPTVRKLVAMTLEKRGFTVVAAFDGVAAIKEIATHNPDLILMDVTMPRLDGYQLCKLVKKHEATRHIPVIMLSGKDGMFDRLRGRLVGCSGYISKPFVPEALVETVEETLAQAAGR